MSSLLPFNMFEFQPDEMTEYVVRDCFRVFDIFIQQVLVRIKNDQDFSLLSDISYASKRADLMEAFEELRRMHRFFEQRYRDFVRAKNAKVRELFGENHDFLEMAGYGQHKHNYRKLMKSIFDHIEACQLKIGGMLEFNQLTRALYNEGRAEMRLLMEELKKKTLDLYHLIIRYHKTKSSMKFASVKREYDMLMEEMTTFVKGEEDQLKTLLAEVEDKEQMLDVKRRDVFQEVADQHTLSELRGFKFKIDKLFETSESYKQAWADKINDLLESQGILGGLRYRIEVSLKALELTRKLHLNHIPPPGLSEEISRRIVWVAKEIRSITSRCSHLKKESQLLLEKMENLRIKEED